MKYKIPHLLYVLLLLISIAITALTFFIKDPAWSTVVASVGAGGIASVGVAWLLDYRKTKIQAIENKARHAFHFWIQLLSSNVGNFPKEGQHAIKRRCTFILSSIESLQRQIEIFQSQSATLIYQDFPNLEQTLQFFEILWTHCWGTLKRLETEDYKGFVDTTYILYLDFINEFPQYKDDLPDEYSINEAIQLLNAYGSHSKSKNAK